MKNHKIISILLCFSVLIQLLSVSTVFTEDAPVVSVEKEVTVLTRLGVLEPQASKIFDTESMVSRLDFTIYAAKLFRISENPNGNLYFADMSKNRDGFGYVAAMVDAGIIDQSKEKRFYPDELVTYEQACKILLCGLGYNELTLEQYEKMMGYTIMAQKVDMGLKLPGQSEMTYSNCVRLLYNALGVEMVQFTGTKGENNIYEVSDQTLLSINRMCVEKGTVEGLRGYRIKNSVSALSDQVVIAGTVFDVYDGFTIEDDLLASYVEYISIKDKKTGENELVYAEKVNPDYEITIQSENIVRLSGNTIFYYPTADSSYERKVNFQEIPLVIYNGSPSARALSKIIQGFLDEDYVGSVRLIKDSNGRYSTLVIDSYSIFFGGSYDADKEMLYAYNNSAAAMDLSKYENVRIVNAEGKEIAVSDTLPVVMAVAVSEDEQSCNIIASSAIVAGVVEYVSGSKETVDIDGKHLKLGKKSWETYADRLYLGAEVKVYCDCFGRIAYVLEQGGSSMSLGYLVGIASQDRIFDDAFVIKLYTPDGMKDFGFAKKVTLDGIRYEVSDYRSFFYNFPDVISMNSVNGKPDIQIGGQLIRYQLNEEGNIAVIDTYHVGNEDPEYTLTRTYTGEDELLCNAGDSRLSLTGYYNWDYTKMFTVPQNDGALDIMDEKNYSNSANFVHDGKYAAEVYYFNGDNLYADVIVVRGGASQENENVYMYSHEETVLGEEGNIERVVVAYCKGVREELLIPEDKPDMFDRIEEGDLFSTYTAYDGKTVRAVTKYYDMSEDRFTASSTNGHWYDATNPNEIVESSYRGVKYNMSKSYAYDVKNSAIKSTYEHSELKSGKANEIQVINQYKPMTLYDSGKKDKFSKGKIEDVRTYKNVGESCSKLLYILRYGTLQQVYIIN